MDITLSTPFTVGEIMQRFELNQQLLQDTKLEPSVSYPYGPRGWLRRALPEDIASRPTPGISRRAPFLHSYFQLEVTEGDDIFTTRKVMSIANVVNRWLSCQFGFFEYNGDIVQINPADLYLYNIYWDFPFDYALKNARVIRPSDKSGDNWAWEMLRYYLFSFLMIGDFKNELKPWITYAEVSNKPTDECALLGQTYKHFNIPVPELNQSWIAKDLENTIIYLKDRAVSRGALLANLLPLGDIVAMGWCPKLHVLADDAIKTPDGFQKLHERVLEQNDIKVYAKGYWTKRFQGRIKDKGLINFVSEEKLKVTKLLKSVSKKYKGRVPKQDLIDLVINANIYNPQVLARRSWFKDKFLKDAKQMDWLIEEKREWCKDEDGESFRQFMVTLTNPKTGNRK